MAHFLIYKRPVEVTPYDVDFSELIPEADTALDTGLTTVTVTNSAGEDKTSYFVQPKLIFSGKHVTAIIVNGLNGEDYMVNFNGVGSPSGLTGGNFSRILEVRVRSKIAGNV